MAPTTRPKLHEEIEVAYMDDEKEKLVWWLGRVIRMGKYKQKGRVLCTATIIFEGEEDHEAEEVDIVFFRNGFLQHVGTVDDDDVMTCMWRHPIVPSDEPANSIVHNPNDTATDTSRVNSRKRAAAQRHEQNGGNGNPGKSTPRRVKKECKKRVGYELKKRHGGDGIVKRQPRYST